MLLLVQFKWLTVEPVDALRAELPGRASLRVFRAVDGDEGRIYVPMPADAASAQAVEARIARTLPGARFVHLAPRIALDGASAGADAPFRYAVETDVQPAQEDDFNAWYDQEHLPGLAGVPGTVRAERWLGDAGPRYHAWYDMTRPETLGSPPWLAVRATPWSARVRPAFLNTRRTMFRRV